MNANQRTADLITTAIRPVELPTNYGDAIKEQWQRSMLGMQVWTPT